MSLNKQTQYGEGTSGMKKSAKKGKKSNQPFSSHECCKANIKLDTPKKEPISKINKPSTTFWFIAQLFVIHANRDDLLWLDNFIKDFENNNDDNANDRAVDSNKGNEIETEAKRMLKKKLEMTANKETSIVSPNVQPHIMRFVFRCPDGRQLIVSRESLESNLTQNHEAPVTKPSGPTPPNKISSEFISRLINFDDKFSHLRGISPKQINDYLCKCREEGCLENMKMKIEKMDKKILSYKKRGNYSLKKERKTTLMYRECQDICLILEKFNDVISGRELPYFMFH